MKIINYYLIIFSSLVCLNLHAQQKISDSNTAIAPNSNAIVELASANRGLLHTRVALESTISSKPLSAHVAGMMVYNTQVMNDVVPGIYYNDGVKWISVSKGIASNIQYNPTTYVLTYVDGNGNTQFIDFKTVVKANETVTTLIQNGTSFTYTNEKNVAVTVDLLAGPKGDTGSAGLDGAKGDKGEKGDTGSAGLDGAKGDKGDKGDTGARGLDGAKGDKGDKGDTGATGLDGAKGDKGDKGDTGSAGLDGEKGDKGDKGDAGTFTATVDNGLNFSSPTNIQLGGSLSNPTEIVASSTNTLAIKGLDEVGEDVVLEDGYHAVIRDPNTGVLYSVELDELFEEGVAANEENTTLSYNPATNILTYLNERSDNPTIDLSGLISSASNGLTKDVASGNIQLGGELIKPTIITTNGTQTLAIVGLQPSTVTADKIVVTDASGVLKSMDQSTMAIEPWNVGNSTTKATANTQNIYQNGNVGIGDFSAENPIAKLDVRGAVRGGLPHADEIAGTSAVGQNSAAFGTENKVIGKSAFATGTQNIVTGENAIAFGAGNNLTATNFSMAMGINNTVAAEGMAIGYRNKINSLLAIGIGQDNTLDAEFAAALGRNNRLSGAYALGIGRNNTVSGIYSLGLGTNNTSTGAISLALGDGNVAAGDFSVAIGEVNSAAGKYSLAMGAANQVSGNLATGIGEGIKVASKTSAGLGQFNAVTTGTPDAWIPTEPILQVGVGADDANRANALTLLKNGNLGVANEAIAPTERIDIGSGNVRIRDINAQVGSASDKMVVADAAGVLKTVGQSSIITEPWNVRLSNNKATLNTQNIYQEGNVAIGTTSANNLFNNKKLFVNGNFRAASSVASASGRYRGFDTQYFNGLTDRGIMIFNVPTSSTTDVIAAANSPIVEAINIADGFITQYTRKNNLQTAFNLNNSSIPNAAYFNLLAQDNTAGEYASTVIDGSTATGLTISSSRLSNQSASLNIDVSKGLTYSHVVGTDITKLANYIFPTNNGSAGQVLTTDGLAYSNSTAAKLSWKNVSEIINITANNGLTKDVASGDIQLGGELKMPTIITTDATQTLAVAGLQESTVAADKMVVADANGVLKVKDVSAQSQMPCWFYAPSVVLPTAPAASYQQGVSYDASTQVFTIDLYSIYKHQFSMTGNQVGASRSAIKSPTATTLPVQAQASLEYFVTYFDNTVFDPNSITLDDNGLMTYKILSTAVVTERTYMNIAFKNKDCKIVPANGQGGND